MSQKKRTTDADRASGYVREVAETAKAGVDHASNYLEGMTDRTVDYRRGTASDTQDKVAELGSRRLDELAGRYASVHEASTGDRAPDRDLYRAGARPHGEPRPLNTNESHACDARAGDVASRL